MHQKCCSIAKLKVILTHLLDKGLLLAFALSSTEISIITRIKGLLSSTESEIITRDIKG